MEGRPLPGLEVRINDFNGGDNAVKESVIQALNNLINPNPDPYIGTYGTEFIKVIAIPVLHQANQGDNNINNIRYYSLKDAEIQRNPNIPNNAIFALETPYFDETNGDMFKVSENAWYLSHKRFKPEVGSKKRKIDNNDYDVDSDNDDNNNFGGKRRKSKKIKKKKKIKKTKKTY